MNIIKFLAKRRLNYIDAVGISGAFVLDSHGHHWWAIICLGIGALLATLAEATTWRYND